MEDSFGALTTEHQDIYERFRSEITNLIRPSFDDYFIWKWIKATNYNIEKAKERFEKHLQFRKRYGLDTILEDFQVPEVVKNHFCYALLGFDKNGNVVGMDLTAYCDYRGLCRSLTHAEQVKNFCYILERIQKMMREENERTGFRVRKLVAIINMKDVRMTQFLDSTVRKMLINVAEITETHYPELLKKFHIINAPYLFYAWFNIFKGFLNPVVVEKVQIFASGGWLEALRETIDLDIMPAFMGGNRTDPDGNPNCNTLLNRGTEVPASYYLSNNSAKVKNDPLAKKVTLRERAYYNQSVYINQQNSTISWSFETVDYDIGFGVYYVPIGVKPMPTTFSPTIKRGFQHKAHRNYKEGHIDIIPAERVNSQHVPETGELICEDIGMYLLHFDNTYSRTRSKTLYYKIQVIPPTTKPNE